MTAAVLALASIQPGQAAAVCGFPGSGKTRDCQFASASWKRSVIFDPYANRDRINRANGNTDCFPWPGDLISTRELLENPDRLEDSNLRVVIHPMSLDPVKMGREFSHVANLCWYTGGGIVLVAEEAGLYSRACAELGQRISTGGRHGGVAMIALSQRIGRLHIDYRSCMQILATGCQNEPADVEAIQKRCGKDFAAKVAAMPHGAPLAVWRAGAGEIT